MEGIPYEGLKNKEFILKTSMNFIIYFLQESLYHKSTLKTKNFTSSC